MVDNHGVTVQEAYRNFVPIVNARRAVDRVLSGIPGKYLSGLKTIVLTNAGGLSHDRRRQKTLFRKRKVLIRESCGLYHQKWQNEPAWIEIFVDNLCRGWPSWLLRMPFFRDLAFADVLFHELGHHIQKTQVPEFKEREDVADKWRGTLNRSYFPRTYRYLLPLIFGLRLALKPFRIVKGDGSIVKGDGSIFGSRD